MAPSPQLRLAYYGDDLTGSTDALEFLTRAGLRTRLFLSAPTADACVGLDAVGVAGLTRAMAADAIASELRAAFAALRKLGARHVHYKVCSTFDSSPTVGSIGRAIDVGAEVFRGRFVPLVVGAPALGRYCVFGNLFARMGIGSAGEIFRLDRHPSMSRHPVTPADESDLRRHLARQTDKRIGLLDILQVSLPPSEARGALETLLTANAEVVLFDALTGEHLATIGALLESYASRETPLFSVGSSAIEMALGTRWAQTSELRSRETWPDPGPAQPLLVISGSCSPITAGQISRAVGDGFGEVALDVSALAEGCSFERAERNIIEHLQAGRHVIAHTGRPIGDERVAVPSDKLGAVLGAIARTVLPQAPQVRRVLLAGGDTSSFAARAMGIQAMDMIAPLAPGAPLCRVSAPGSPLDGREINFKGGQVGAADYFGAVARGKL